MTDQSDLLPSSKWMGFYTYRTWNRRHAQEMCLSFQDGIIRGEGLDDIGYFSVTGFYDAETRQCRWHKKYSSHTIYYNGFNDNNRIWGTWEEPAFLWNKGGFQLWPEGYSEAVSESEHEEVGEPVVVGTSNERRLELVQV